MAKILWAKALTDYLKDETLSYTSIASKYGVSLQAVKKRAGKEEWQNLRQKSIQKVKPVVDLSLMFMIYSIILSTVVGKFSGFFLDISPRSLIAKVKS